MVLTGVHLKLKVKYDVKRSAQRKEEMLTELEAGYLSVVSVQLSVQLLRRKLGFVSTSPPSTSETSTLPPLKPGLTQSAPVEATA